MNGRDEAGWPAPAKLNLFLHILGRRADGFHTLQTVFQFLDFGDTLHFRVGEGRRVRLLTSVAGVAEEDNLVVRAARALQEAAGCDRGAEIRIEKRLPAGGGLGGGSSDAATTLVALDRLWGLDLGTERLAELALDLGADVPVFVRGTAAWAEGVGETLTPVDLPEPWYLVVAPPGSVSTAAVFGDPELTRDCPPITIDDFLRGAGHNVCESVVCRRYPAVAAALTRSRGYGEARMTGTGGCIFVAFERRADAQAAQEGLAADWRAFVARGRNRSPLQERLQAQAG
ncbi:MAG TPA: 4-(cytidine 5'-diphospho)-2-C-methyl-D-erythritol kinase [Gammaproteobacteria bacterium]|nr:4-(cytidine 5'-diphospho)-2-C-methyl-D-erythritol kinase [Gammaproteobacteria bacterium]